MAIHTLQRTVDRFLEQILIDVNRDGRTIAFCRQRLVFMAVQAVTVVSAGNGRHNAPEHYRNRPSAIIHIFPWWLLLNEFVSMFWQTLTLPNSDASFKQLSHLPDCVKCSFQSYSPVYPIA